MEKETGTVRDRTAAWQGLYYAASGLWPLLHLPSFMRVTGPKAETWLVRTVGALVLVSGGALALAGRRRRVTPEMALIGAGQALALTMVDTIYATKRRISKIYLADAALQLLVLAGWLRGRSTSRSVRS
jgi:hypothetical protein